MRSRWVLVGPELLMTTLNATSQEANVVTSASNPLKPQSTVGFQNYCVPVGLGNVILANDKVPLNAFIEPRYTMFNDDAGGPLWQIFASALPVRVGQMMTAARELIMRKAMGPKS